AVRSRDRERPFEPHQLGKHFGAPHHRKAPRPRGGNLRIVRVDRRGNDDDLRGAQISGRVPDSHRYPEFAKPPDIRAIGEVAALNPIAEVMQYLGYATHADSTDAHKMKGADCPGKGPHAACPAK